MASKKCSKGGGIQVVSAKDLYSKVLPRRLRGKSAILEGNEDDKDPVASKNTPSKDSSGSNTGPLRSYKTSPVTNTVAHESCRTLPCPEDDGGEIPTIAPGYWKRPSLTRSYSDFHDPAESKRRHSSYIANYIEREMSSSATGPSTASRNSQNNNGPSQLQRRLSDNGTASQAVPGYGEGKPIPPKKPPRRTFKEDWCPPTLSSSVPGRGDLRSVERGSPTSPGAISGLKRPGFHRSRSMSLEDGGTIVYPIRNTETAAAENVQSASIRAYERLIPPGGHASSVGGAASLSTEQGSLQASTARGHGDGGESVDVSKVDTPSDSKRSSEPLTKEGSLSEAPAAEELSFSDGGDNQPKKHQSKEHIIYKDDSLTVLQACVACLQPSSDLKLLLCFHILCPECVSSSYGERDGRQVIVCAVCQEIHAVPPEGLTSLASVYHGLLSENYTCSRSIACSLENEPLMKDDTSDTAYSTEGTLLIHPVADRTSVASRVSSEEPISPKSITSQDKHEYGGSAQLCKSTNTEAEADVTVSKLDADRNADPSSASREDKPESKPRPTSTDTTKSQASDSSHDSSIVSETQTMRLCGACQTRSDTCHTCVTCGGVLLCEGCRVAHLNLPVTRSHEVLPVPADSVSPLVLLAHHQLTCPVHGQDLALMCVTCGVFLCHRCLVPQHARHDTKELASVHHSKRKQLSTLQRTVKQHLLAVKSAGRTVDEQLQKVERTRQHMCDFIENTAQRHIQQITRLAAELTDQVKGRTDDHQQVLEKTRAAVTHSLRECQNLRCVLGAVTDQTPHLTSLTLLQTCQGRYDALRSEVSLAVEEFEDLVFCPDPRLDAEVGRPGALGSVRTVSLGVPGTVMTSVGTFKVCPDPVGLAVTPYGEVVSISAASGRCQVWDCHGVLLLDASRHVTCPCAVQVLTTGVIVLLDTFRSSTTGKGAGSCLKLISPSGTLLSQVPLSSSVSTTRIHCPNDSAILISDGQKKTVTLYSMERGSSVLKALRTVRDDLLLRSPCQVTTNVNADWVVNDGCSTLRVVSPDGRIDTILCNDEIEAMLQPPRRGSQLRRPGDTRALRDVCCDRKGHVITADVARCGLYVITGGTTSNRERHFVSLKALSTSTQITAICIDGQDRIYVGMQDGIVNILKIGSVEDKEARSEQTYANTTTRM